MNLRALLREQSSGAVLFVSTLAALIWANSPWSEIYHALWQKPLSLGYGTHTFTEPLVLWINDGLMALFFFVVGLEIKSEVLGGRLSSARTAALPLVAAAGGMIAPAAIYGLFNAGTSGASGWGIPMATDIAFALGVLTLLGERVPSGLKVFLVALAVVDDIGAVVVIALFYSSEFHPLHLGIAFAYVVALLVAKRLGLTQPFLYLLVGLAGVWHCFFLSGIHPTVAGILLALTMPARSRDGSDVSPLEHIRSVLNPWVSFFVLPLFALANAGVSLSWKMMSLHGDLVALGIVGGLVLGKQIGIFGFASLAVRLGLASLPAGVTWRHLYGASWLGGIGFTMSLFIASLAFYGTAHLQVAKSAVLVASLVAGTTGWLILRRPEARIEIIG